MHNVLIIFYIAFSIGNLFILPELVCIPGIFPTARIRKTGDTEDGDAQASAEAPREKQPCRHRKHRGTYPAPAFHLGRPDETGRKQQKRKIIFFCTILA